MKLKNKKEILSSLKAMLIEQLKGAAVKAALKAFLGTAAGTGIKVWIIKFAVENLYDEVGEPIIKAGLVQAGYYYHKLDGKIIIRKIKKAREENDGQAYDSSVDDVFDLRRE
jgi:hypothetical protein